MNPNYIIWAITFLLLAGGATQRQTVRSISEKGIYFFGPSQAEVDSMDENNSEAINDFTYYINEIGPFLGSHQLKSTYISDRTIEVRPASKVRLTIHRDSVDFGTIMLDGRSNPKLFKYVLTDVELKEQITRYFKLK